MDGDNCFQLAEEVAHSTLAAPDMSAVFDYVRNGRVYMEILHLKSGQNYVGVRFSGKPTKIVQMK